MVDNSAVKCPSCGMNVFINVCENCGNEFEDGLHCPKCGVKVGKKAKICPRCKEEYYTNACPNCGFTELKAANPEPTVIYRTVEPAPMVGREPKNKWITFLLCLFFGFFGAHKFYEGKIGYGILYIMTMGIFFVGWIVDIFLILNKPTTYYVN